MAHPIKMPSELDEGNLYVYIAKLEKRMQEIEKRYEAVARKLEITQEKAKEAVSKSQYSLVTATRAIKTRSLSVKKRTPEKKTNPEKKYPAYPMWMDYLKSIYVPVVRAEFNKMWLKREIVYNADVRRELALKFGQQMLDDNFISQRSVTNMMKVLGFKVNVHRLMPNLEGWGNIAVDGAIMCKRVTLPEEEI